MPAAWGPRLYVSVGALGRWAAVSGPPGVVVVGLGLLCLGQVSQRVPALPWCSRPHIGVLGGAWSWNPQLLDPALCVDLGVGGFWRDLGVGLPRSLLQGVGYSWDFDDASAPVLSSVKGTGPGHQK